MESIKQATAHLADLWSYNVISKTTYTSYAPHSTLQRHHSTNACNIMHSGPMPTLVTMTSNVKFNQKAYTIYFYILYMITIKVSTK